MMCRREHPHHEVWAAVVLWRSATYKPYSCSHANRKTTIFLPLTNPTVVPTQTGKQRSSCYLQALQTLACSRKTTMFLLPTILTNPTVVPYHLQTLQLFPPNWKSRLSCTSARGDSLGLPEGAWSAEYSIKHDYSAQVRTETHSASLRVRGVQNTR